MDEQDEKPRPACAQQRELSGKRDITTEDETHSERRPCDRSSSGNSR